MRHRRPPRVDLSADMTELDSTSIQESFLLVEEETKRKIEMVSRSEYRRGHKITNNNNNNSGYESSDGIFMLHCSSPLSHASTITMDLLSPSSSMMTDSSIMIEDDASLPLLPDLQAVHTDEAMIGTVGGIDIGTSFLPDTSPITSSDKGPTVFMDDGSFTYVTLEDSKSSNSSGDVFNGIANATNPTPATLNFALHTPHRAAMRTPHSYSQTPYTYETIEGSDAMNRTGFASQFTFETIHTSGKENTPDRTNTTRKNKRERIDLSAQESPLESRRMIYSPLPRSGPASTPKDKKKQMQTVDLDYFSIDEYTSSPDKSVNCFSIDSYSSKSADDDGLGFGGTGMTTLDMARTKRDQSLFRLRSMGGGKLHSMRPLPVPSQHNSSTGGISQRKDHVAKQRRRLSEVFQSYCLSMEA